MTLAAHKIALDPNEAQATYFARACGVARFAYNWALEEWNRMYAAGEKPNWQKLQKKLNAIKDAEFPWMKEVTKHSPQNAIQHLGEAFARYFAKKARYPRFKKKGRHDSFVAARPDLSRGYSVETDGKWVKLPRIGWVRMRQAVRFNGQIRRATISRVAGRWFVTLLIDTPDIRPVPARAKRAAVGVDLGVTTLATLSTGEKVEGPKPGRRLLSRLRRLSRSLSRKVKGSANRRKAKAKLARLHYRIRCIRSDALHKLTTRLAKGFRVVGVEDLNVRGMLANRHLSFAIADGGFGEFRRQLAYKCEWYGTRLVVADRFFASSKTCPDCGAKNDALALKDRFWICPGCGGWHDRDVAAAVNLEHAARSAVSACGAGSAGTVRKGRAKLPAAKQEAT